jgi:hypothetical protein
MYYEFGTDFGYWDVDARTRIMSNSYGGFGSGTHTPLWIYTEISLGNVIPIAVDGEGDHEFKVSGESTYYIPGFGILDVWLLQDLTVPGGFARYEKSTGILLSGIFFYSNGLYNYTFELFNTNAFGKSLTITIPDSSSSWETDTSEFIYWTSTGLISGVKIELYKDGVYVMEITSDTLNDGVYSWAIPSTLDSSTLYQIKISDVADPSIFDFSDNFGIENPAIGPGRIPGYNFYILIGAIGLISVILVKNRLKHK